MPQGTASSKVVNVSWFSIEDPADFGACQKAVAAVGFFGRTESMLNASGQAEWKLTISSTTQINVEVTFGQVLIWDGKMMTVYQKADALSRFNIT